MCCCHDIHATLTRIERKVDKIMTAQNEIDADVTELTTAVAAISAEITVLQTANPALDLTQLKAAVDAVAALAPPAAPVA